MFYKNKALLKISQNSQENICVGVSFLIKFIKKETPTQVFSCEFCEIFNNAFFSCRLLDTWIYDKVFKNGQYKICGKQPLQICENSLLLGPFLNTLHIFTINIL